MGSERGGELLLRSCVVYALFAAPSAPHPAAAPSKLTTRMWRALCTGSGSYFPSPARRAALIFSSAARVVGSGYRIN